MPEKYNHEIDQQDLAERRRGQRIVGHYLRSKGRGATVRDLNDAELNDLSGQLLDVDGYGRTDGRYGEAPGQLVFKDLSSRNSSYERGMNMLAVKRKLLGAGGIRIGEVNPPRDPSPMDSIGPHMMQSYNSKLAGLTGAPQVSYGDPNSFSRNGGQQSISERKAQELRDKMQLLR